MTDFTGRKLGKYELIERLGRGGMAEVYKAYQPGLDRYVAIKVMLGHLAESENFVTRFRREAQIVGKLRHPNIVQVIDFDVEADVYYMVMEYIRGETLKAYIQRRGALPVLDAFRITAQLSDALSYAHNEGMIHRDIKPANVMFMDNTYKNPVLTDFGIARILSDAGMTASGAFIGTPAYMAPEIGKGEKADERVDIYSMGIMLYEMLIGSVPYDADTPFAVVLKHISAPIPAIRQMNAHFSEVVERIIFKVLAKEPNDRFQTAADLRDAIQKSYDELETSAELVTDTGESRAVSREAVDRTWADDERTIASSEFTSARTAVTTPVTIPKPPSEVITRPSVTTEAQKIPSKRRLPVRVVVGLVVVIALFVIGGLLLSSQSSTEDDDDETPAAIISNSTETASTPDGIATDSSTEVVSTPEGVTTANSTEVAVVVTENAENNVVQQLQPFIDGLRALEDEDYETARELFTSIIETRTNPDVELYLRRAEAAAALGDFEGAVQDLQTASELTPDDADIYEQLGWLYYELEQYDNAIAAFTQAIALNPDDADYYVVRGDALLSSGQSLMAIRDYRQVLTLDETYYPAYAGIGEAYDNLDLTTIAIENYRLYVDALGVDAEDYVVERLAELEAELTAQPTVPQEGYYSAYLPDDDPAIIAIANESLDLINNQGIDPAFARINEGLETYPDNPILLRIRSEMNLGLGNIEAALADAERAIELYPDHPAAHLAWANYHRNVTYDYNLAFDEITTAYELAPNNPEVVLYYARGWRDRGDTDKTADLYYQVEALGMPLEFYLPERFDFFWERWWYENMLDDGYRLMEYFPDDNAFRMRVAAAHVALGDFQSAIEVIEEIGIDLQDSYYVGNAAYVYYAAGDYDRARQIAGDLILVSREDVEARGRYVMALVEAQAGNYGQALEHLAAIENVETWRFQGEFLNPRFSHWITIDQARIYVAMGDVETALIYYNKMIEEQSWWGVPYLERGKIYADQARIELARQDFLFALDYAGNVSDGELYDEVFAYLQALHPDIAADLRPVYSFYLPDDNPEVIDQANNLYWLRESQGPERSLQEVDMLLETYPNDPILLQLRSEYLVNLESYDEANTTIEKLSELHPDHPATYLARAFYLHTVEDNLPEALDKVDTALVLSPDNPTLNLYKGYLLQQLGRWDDALEQFDRAEDLGMPLGFVLGSRLQIYWETENLEGIIEDGLRFIRIGNTDYRVTVAYAYLRLDRTQEAYQLVAENPLPFESQPFFQGNRAYIFYAVGRLNEAQAIAETTLMVNADYGYEQLNISRYVLGLVARSNGDYQTALEYLLPLAETRAPWTYESPFLNPTFGHEIHHDIARIYVRMDEPETALEYYTRAIETYSWWYLPYLERANVYITLGDEEAARQDLQSAYDGATNDRLRENILERLRALSE